MRAFARHRLIRCATLFLLAWITVDLCWPDACAGDAFDVSCPANCLSHSGENGHGHSGLLHPDHCFCHARSVTLAAAPPIPAPTQSCGVSFSVQDVVASQSLAPVYHPPQSAA